MAFHIVTAVLVSTLAASTDAYSSGAQNNVSNPMSSMSSNCVAGNFRPNHGTIMPQSTPAPYTITVLSPRDAIYRPNQDVKFVIETKGAGSPPFKGFFIRGDSSEAAFAGAISCDLGRPTKFCAVQAGVTHTNSTDKTVVSCTWTPPDFQIGAVQFQATIVQRFEKFWTGVMGTTVLQPSPTTMTYEQKGQQLREEMMAKFRAQAARMGNMFNQAGGSKKIAEMFAGLQKQAGGGIAGMMGGLRQGMQGMLGNGMNSRGQSNAFGGFQGFNMNNFRGQGADMETPSQSQNFQGQFGQLFQRGMSGGQEW